MFVAASSQVQASSFVVFEPEIGEQSSFGLGISDDGQTVVGIAGASISTLDRLWKWTPRAGNEDLPGLQNWIFYKNQLARVEAGPVDYRLRTESGFLDLPGLSINEDEPSFFSRDGSVAAGDTFFFPASQAYRWSEALGVQRLIGSTGPQIPNSGVSAASSDGSVLVGHSLMAGRSEATLWRDGVPLGLGFLSSPVGSVTSEALDVSGDGSVVVGTSFPGPSGPVSERIEAFVWTGNGGMKGLGFLPGHVESYAIKISADGRIVLGSGNSATGREGFLWTEAGGMRTIKEVLIAAGIDVSGWSNLTANDFSDDGTFLIGGGLAPDGTGRNWWASIPEPQVGLLLLLSGLLPSLRTRVTLSGSGR